MLFLPVAVLSRSQLAEDQVEANRREAESKLMRAAVSLLEAGDSYADLTVERIAEAAGRTRTAFYVYFRDKGELLMRLTEGVSELLFVEADRWWSGVDGPADLEQALTNILRIYRDHAAVLRAVVEASAYDEQVGSFWRGLIGRFIAATERRLVTEGEADKGAAHARAFVLVWATERACYQHMVRGGSLDDGTLVRALAEVWKRAVYLAG